MFKRILNYRCTSIVPYIFLAIFRDKKDIIETKIKQDDISCHGHNLSARKIMAKSSVDHNSRDCKL